MKSIVSRVPIVFKVTSSHAIFESARQIIPTTSKSFSSMSEIEAMDHKALTKRILSFREERLSFREERLSFREEFLSFRDSIDRRLGALENGTSSLIKDTAGELLLHCIGVEPKLDLKESVYFEQHRRKFVHHDIVEKVSIARTFLPSNLELADFDRVINNRHTEGYSMTAELLQLRVKECMDLFQDDSELAKIYPIEHAILSQYEVLHKEGIV